MTEGARKPGFELQVGYDQEELLGARWWQQGMRVAAARTRGATVDESRRAALKALIVVGGAVIVAGVVAGGTCSRRRTVQVQVARNSIDLQRERGLAVGAENTAFGWPDAIGTTCTGDPLDRETIDSLAASMGPHDAALRPAYVPTLFQCVANAGQSPFVRSLTMVRSAAMVAAFAQGEAIRELFEYAEQPARWALLIDLPGPASVAFAAGLQPFADAVFVFDNWPHPRGVVPAHLTLAAAVHYRPRFAPDARRRGAPAAFVLDRNRLNPYQNEPDRFDNRYVARLPDAPFLRERGVERVLYVVPAGVEKELDDLNERFVAWRAAGIEIKLLSLGDVQPEAPRPATVADTKPAPAPRYYWHGSPAYHWWFWNHYAWASRPSPIAPQRPPTSSLGSGYAPSRRTTLFGGGARVGQTNVTRSEPDRSSGGGGSWGRSSGGFGG